MGLKLLPITDKDIPQFKSDMQQAFQLGAQAGGYPSDELILPEEDIDKSLRSHGSAAYKAVENGKLLGGAIVVTDSASGKGHLDFLYVKHGIQGRGIGRFIWFELEKLYPEIIQWETCTPYFEKRNIHFYVNVCGFHITEYWCKYHKSSDDTDNYGDADDDGMFAFKKTFSI